MSSASEQQNALTDGIESIQCSASCDDHDDETKRQPEEIESFLEVLAAVALAVAARSIEPGQGVTE